MNNEAYVYFCNVTPNYTYAFMLELLKIHSTNKSLKSNSLYRSFATRLIRNWAEMDYDRFQFLTN